MAAEKQTKSDQTTEESQPAEVKTLDSSKLKVTSGQKHSFLKKKLLVIVLAVFVLLVSGYFLLMKLELIGEKTYGRVGTYKVTQAELDTLLNESPSMSKENAVKSLLDLNLYRQAAGSAGIKVTPEEVAGEVKNRTGGTTVSYPKYLNLLVEKDMLRKKIDIRVPGYSQGRVVIINFGHHLDSGSGGLAPGESEKLRPKYIADDRAAADALKDQIYNELKSGKINFDQAIKLEHDDPKLGINSLPTYIHSSSFNTQDPTTPIYNYIILDDFKKLIDKTNVNQFSEPVVIKLAITPDPNSIQEAYWGIVQIDSRTDRLADGVEVFISNKKSELKYRINK